MKAKDNSEMSITGTNGETTEKTSRGVTNLVVILTALVFIALSAVVLFMPEAGFKPSYLCYVVGAAVIIVGIVQIVRYFVNDAYRNMNEYGFSIGTLLCILGICILLRAEVISAVIDLVLGVVVLLMGIVMLQHSLDLKRMSDAVWGLVIVISALVIACGVVLILKPSPLQISYDTIIWWTVLVSSALGLLVNIYTMIRIALYTHKEKKQATQAHSADPAIQESRTDTATAQTTITDESGVSETDVSESGVSESGVTPVTEGDPVL
ncbi:MAG: DUF308 domain-containing protein [Lachnospiraceae bacterium]|nr:DUF308 domain-containing protein [Lachnospiraceae bacterium]